jgi:hypothetical protein
MPPSHKIRSCEETRGAGGKMKGTLKLHGLIGGAIFCIAVVMLRQRQEPWTTYFYSFAWWSYIAVADGLVYWMRGRSLIVNKTRIFLGMIPLSIFIWCLFEGFNLRLANWHYINLPPVTWMRWVGYAIAYGTVLPGLCETMHLLHAVGPFRGVTVRKLSPTPFFLRTSLVSGGIALSAVLLFPRYFFPLVWIGFVFLIEPILYLQGGDSLFHDIKKGEFDRTLTILAAGIVCGMLWELWNFWAQAKWIYTVPFFEGGKLFEMPLLGFLGFPPFAVSAYALYRILVIILQKSKMRIRVIIWSLIVLSSLLSFVGIDRFTVVSFIPLTKDLPGVKVQWYERLHNTGMDKVYDLVRRNRTSLVPLGIPLPEAEEILREAEIVTLKGIGTGNYCLLREAGVKDLSQLARQDPYQLYPIIQDKGRLCPLPHRTPTLALVKLWISAARKEEHGSSAPEKILPSLLKR